VRGGHKAEEAQRRIQGAGGDGGAFGEEDPGGAVGGIWGSSNDDQQLEAGAGEACRRAVCAQQFRASGLNLVIAAIVFWNSTYIADAVAHLHEIGEPAPDTWLPHTSPLSWEHISLSGDFLWDRAAATAEKR
jgi:hypothetical protein